jgi:hypothetical protein
MDGAGQPNLRITSASDLESLYWYYTVKLQQHLTRLQSSPPMASISAMSSVRNSMSTLTCYDAHSSCRLPRPLRRGHDQWRADANHERYQEDAESILERELRHVRHIA